MNLGVMVLDSSEYALETGDEVHHLILRDLWELLA